MLGLSLSVLSFKTAPDDMAVEAGCTPSPTQGCFNGKPYDFKSEFPCGPHNIYSYDTASCCEQGRPFGTDDEYCCTGSGRTGVHSYSDGKCDLDTIPDKCICEDSSPSASWQAANMVTAVSAIEVPVGDGDDLIDTTTPPEGGYLCKDRTNDVGCLNGYTFDFDTYTSCGGYLMKYGKYGCCPSSAGFLPYPFGTLYCCKIEGAPAGQEYQLGPSACKCHAYGC